ncbi:hypothetical protein GOEFS_098_00290 [Gordonia effusa NBRC 100432]|uniref:Peptidase C30 domain-containing protein n=1 Tax=Gordonia effusa NBRC 100432 TaxID=1077974 RepID=H0R4G2_9ACTN|nr:hypothetical protein [Gordonia effusa]GAB19963.1 hypothetical protein GOEFS_098_00290 [Gordonia effusa NBRC 100432]
MSHSRSRIKVGAAALAAAGAIGATLVGGSGQAVAASAAYPLSSCIGLSPNVVDLPYNPTRVIVADYAGKTYLTTEFSSLWGYQSAVRLDLRNLRTGKRLSLRSDRRVSPPYVGTHQISFPTSQIGTGRVSATLSSVNRNALWSVPATTCSGTIVVR